jgi:hypothetical protein
MFRFTTSAVAAAPTPLETGMTPIPPLNFTRVSLAAAESGQTTPTHNANTNNLLAMATPPV